MNQKSNLSAQEALFSKNYLSLEGIITLTKK